MYHLEPDPIEQLDGADDREASEETHVATNLQKLKSRMKNGDDIFSLITNCQPISGKNQYSYRIFFSHPANLV